MPEFSPFDVEQKLEALGKAALLAEIPTYNSTAQKFYYKTIVEIESQNLEKYKISLQEEANALTEIANKKAGWALAISILACLISAVATIYSAKI